MLNQLEELDLCEENIIEINILQKLKDNNQTYIELLLQKRCYIEEMRNEYQKSSSYEKREKIHDKYLNALETVKNISENKQPKVVYKLLTIYNPEILAGMTGGIILSLAE